MAIYYKIYRCYIALCAQFPYIDLVRQVISRSADWTMDRDDRIHSLIDVGEVFWYQLNSEVLEKDRIYEGKQRQSDG